MSDFILNFLDFLRKRWPICLFILGVFGVLIRELWWKPRCIRAIPLAEYRAYINPIIEKASVTHPCALQVDYTHGHLLDFAVFDKKADAVRPYIRNGGIFNSACRACKTVPFGQYADTAQTKAAQAELLKVLKRLRELAK